MSFNGSGVFVVNSTGQPVVASTLIQASVFNAFTADVATGLSTAILKDGTQTVTANIPFGGFKLTNVGSPTARSDAATLGSVQDGSGVYAATVGGTADVITLTPSPVITAYAAGQTFRFIASGSNTTNVTVNVSSLGAKAITKNGSTALAAGDIASGAMVEITYDGTRFILGSGNVFLSGAAFTGVVAVPDGTAAAPSLKVGDEQNGLFSPAANQLGFALAGGSAGTMAVSGFTYMPTNPGADTVMIVNNASNTAGSGAQIAAKVGGASAADPYVLFSVTGVSNLTVGVDNSDSDKFKIDAGATPGSATIFSLDPATGNGAFPAGTLTATAMIGCVILGTEQASTSGTSIDFTSIPAGTKRITIMFKGVSTNGSSNLLVQLGDSGGIENSGYLSNAVNYGTSIVQSTAGFVVTGANGATATVLGKVVIDLENSAAFSWISSGTLFDSTGNLQYMSAGSKSTSAELDRVRITTVNGTDAFDAGAINISYER